MTQKVFVGMSGGVDSSVTAALLVRHGYDVTGVYMKNWSQDLPGLVCPWREDYQDAQRVAVHLGIPFKMYDFQTGYRQKVVDYMVAEYQAGRTPNPDVMCNQEVKFKLFLETCLEDGADMIATGHYARVVRAGDGSAECGVRRKKEVSGTPTSHSTLLTPDSAALYAALDANKDQTYFLYRVTEIALAKTLFPLGELTKPEVRELAHGFGLSTAEKPDSQGICFVGKVGIKDFLLHELDPQPAGAIIDQNGREVGRHDGAIFYTIGQRHGLKTGGGLPYYVTGKDMPRNEVYATTDLGDSQLWKREFTLTDIHWINEALMAPKTEVRSVESGESLQGASLLQGGTLLQVRTRYRAPLVEIKHLEKLANGSWKLKLAQDIRAVTPGQSAVIYNGERVLGGGIVF